jgi:hypothetical protein
MRTVAGPAAAVHRFTCEAAAFELGIGHPLAYSGRPMKRSRNLHLSTLCLNGGKTASVPW